MALSRWRKLLTITLPALVVAAVALAAGVEVWVRATWDLHKGRPGFFLSDARRGQRLAAGYDGWFAGIPVHINSLELRDSREYDLTKKPNTFRILVLGDSVTFGHGSVHAYPELLEGRLKAWRPEIDWQVWNAAVPGYNTSQELAHLLEVGSRFQPDLVIVGFSRTTSPTIAPSSLRGACAFSPSGRCRSRGAISIRWNSTRRCTSRPSGGCQAATRTGFDSSTWTLRNRCSRLCRMRARERNSSSRHSSV